MLSQGSQWEMEDDSWTSTVGSIHPSQWMSKTDIYSVAVQSVEKALLGFKAGLCIV